MSGTSVRRARLTAGALLGSAIPIYFTDWQSPLVLILMLALGAVGGALFAAIPAFLKNRFSANEILTSLMLVYVAQLLLDWLVRGPWRDPDGYNFPQSDTLRGLGSSCRFWAREGCISAPSSPSPRSSSSPS